MARDGLREGRVVLDGRRMGEAFEDDEPLNVYDAEGTVTGAMPRAEAKRSGLAKRGVWRRPMP